MDRQSYPEDHRAGLIAWLREVSNDPTDTPQSVPSELSGGPAPLPPYLHLWTPYQPFAWQLAPVRLYDLSVFDAGSSNTRRPTTAHLSMPLPYDIHKSELYNSIKAYATRVGPDRANETQHHRNLHCDHRISALSRTFHTYCFDCHMQARKLWPEYYFRRPIVAPVLALPTGPPFLPSHFTQTAASVEFDMLRGISKYAHVKPSNVTSRHFQRHPRRLAHRSSSMSEPTVGPAKKQSKQQRRGSLPGRMTYF